jgi:hypothetical protein
MHSNYGEQHNNKKKDYKKLKNLRHSNKTSRPDNEKLCIFAY